ncbi:hypothetical protein RRG08_026376 [Elysia crispata]|uniref:Uncharacterized protein n=1 Tax=Elysia crispata TaxID=231223 RepID=A0AAE0XRX8_9GAST|nr:hypothetical protein RRG08_026376 [Elysia crispata]
MIIHVLSPALTAIDLSDTATSDGRETRTDTTRHLLIRKTVTSTLNTGGAYTKQTPRVFVALTELMDQSASQSHAMFLDQIPSQFCLVDTNQEAEGESHCCRSSSPGRLTALSTQASRVGATLVLMSRERDENNLTVLECDDDVGSVSFHTSCGVNSSHSSYNSIDTRAGRQEFVTSKSLLAPKPAHFSSGFNSSFILSSPHDLATHWANRYVLVSNAHDDSSIGNSHRAKLSGETDNSHRAKLSGDIGNSTEQSFQEKLATVTEQSFQEKLALWSPVVLLLRQTQDIYYSIQLLGFHGRNKYLTLISAEGSSGRRRGQKSEDVAGGHVRETPRSVEESLNIQHTGPSLA